MRDFELLRFAPSVRTALVLHRAGMLTALTLAAAALAGCPGDASRDAGDAHFDVADARGDGDGAADVPDAMACNGPAVEDLAMLATPGGDGGTGLDYTGSNDSAPDGLDQNLQPPRSCDFRAVHERLFSYTLRTTAALRVSTDNPGTDPTLDSVIFIASAPCRLPLAPLACDDDDPFAPAQPHVTASLATTAVLPMGTQVVIAIAGFYPGVGTGQAADTNSEVGQFELTVDELPPVTLGSVCDASGRTNVCPMGASCINDTATATGAYHCVADGSAVGAACGAAVGDAGSACGPMLACDASSNRCYQTVADGAGCDTVSPARDRCGTASTCVTAVRGAARGVCAANGSRPQTPCVERHCTGDGLFCHFADAMDATGTCLLLAAPGAPCVTLDTACATGTTCLSSSPGGNAGTCVRAGTAAGASCRDDVIECDGDLFCISSFTDRTCKSVASSVGDACGTWGACSQDWSCVRLDPSDPYHGVCIAPGAAGGPCNAAGPACSDVSLTCTNPTQRASGVCLANAVAGAACDPGARRTRCASGTRCVWQGPGGADGLCLADGSAAGAACATGHTCTGGLYCEGNLNAGVSGLTGTAGTCQAAADKSLACDPRGYTVHCPTGAVCAARSRSTGVCAAPTMETEPDDTVPAATAIALPGVVEGSLPHDDVDCFGLDVTAGAALYAQATSPSGACSDNIALDLYGPDGRARGTDNDSGPFTCPRIDGSDAGFGWAAGLSAGRYTVCVREASSDRRNVAAYVLSLQVSAP